jgi:hypothetical protein
MKNFKNFIQNLEKRTMFFIYVFVMIGMTICNSSTDKFENGYLFFFSFSLGLSLYMLILVSLLRGLYNLEGLPRIPFFIMKYTYYFMIPIVSSAPFLYLWGMRHVISHLKW